MRYSQYRNIYVRYNVSSINVIQYDNKLDNQRLNLRLHKTVQKMWNLNIWILVTIFTCTNGYDRKCPHSSQWNFKSRSYECLDQKIYICLFDAKAVYTERCGPEDLSREGFRYILTPDLHQVACTASRYQPFTFTTDGNSQCVFSKSLCKSSGQILANNGSSSTDIHCRCDYRQNYDYVIPPKDPCACKPSEEDCSCYIRKCDNGKNMIADYRCLKNIETILPEDIKCPIISRIIPSEEADTVHKIQLLSVVTSSRTWSNQASVVLIVIVIIYAVLIGFLFFSVPHVTSISLKSKLELSVKREENEFMIMNGEKVKIECNVESFIPVRSVTWQKEIDGEIIEITQSEEKYEMNCGKRPFLTINNFNADDQGKYRCIVRNVFCLRNKLFGSCMNYMSNVGWLTGFVTVLQHIPAFHTRDITLHTYDFDTQSKPTVYNVYKEESITLEQHIKCPQKLLDVKWFKESDKWTELDINNKQYSGGVLDLPSLTLKTTTVDNAGKYGCLQIYDNGETRTSIFKLKIMPQVKIYKALLEHRGDKTFIRPAICDTIDKHIQENNIVVITGRKGTGKSKICLELASLYDDKDYMIMKVDLSENYTSYTIMVDTMLIIDDQYYTQDSLSVFMKHLLPVLLERNIKVILTCRTLENVKRVSEINTLNGEAFIDINNCLTAEKKEEIINRYLKVYNIAIAASNESNFRDPKILTDLSVEVSLEKDVIKIIRNEEPWIGFPMCASLFCSERKFLHLGEKYFTNPPRYIFDELRDLYTTAKKATNCIDKINDYCVLVYIMKNNNHQLDLNDNNLCSQLNELYQTFFRFKYIPEKPGSNDDQKKTIEEAVHRMNKYLKFHEGVYEFIHPFLSKAMFLSSESMVPFLLQTGSLHDITEFVRSENYTALKNELVIKIGEEYHHILCEKLVRHAFENHVFLLHVAEYIYSYWRLSGNNLVNKMFKHIECILFRSLEVHTDDMLSHDAGSLSESSINLEGSVQFSKIIILLDELTYKGRDPWIYGPGSADFLILGALISAAIGRYATNRKQTFNILLEEFRNRIHSKSFVKLWSKPLDMHGNTFFHYLMLFKQMDEPDILYVNDYIFDTENSKEYTPLDIAAYLGKVSVLEDLNLKTNCTNKLRERLQKLVKSGHVKFYSESIKSKMDEMDEMDNTKGNDATSEKLQSKDADVEKVKHKSKKKKILFKRTFSHSKNKPKKIEQHGSNYSELEFIDVLCFDDDMIKVIDFGNTMDYNAIIQLLSK